MAEGVYAGAHRSFRKGAGVEFGGQRPYVPGDDLRFFDRRALLRHDKLMVREFETETDRALWIVPRRHRLHVVPRRGAPPAPSSPTPASSPRALARIAVASGDPVGLAWIGGVGVHGLPPMAGREAFERVVGAIEGAAAAGDALVGSPSRSSARSRPSAAARAADRSSCCSRTCSISPPARSPRSPRSATGGRTLVAVRVLDPAEKDLGFSGTVRLRALEGETVVEADADLVRPAYRERLGAIAAAWNGELTARGGRFVDATTGDDATSVVRAILLAVAEARR